MTPKPALHPLPALLATLAPYQLLAANPIHLQAPPAVRRPPH